MLRLDSRGWWLGPAVAALAAIVIARSGERPDGLTREPGPDGARFGLSLEERRGLFSELVSRDPHWRWRARVRFPDDVWAQADHWTDQMAQHVRAVARERRLSVAQILLSYDEGLHRQWQGPGGRRLPADWPPLPLRKRR